jgi:hypothetical protein
MATKSQLKQYFETGKIPTQAQFGELIDSIFNIIGSPDGSLNINSDENNIKLSIKNYRSLHGVYMSLSVSLHLFFNNDIKNGTKSVPVFIIFSTVNNLTNSANANIKYAVPNVTLLKSMTDDNLDYFTASLDVIIRRFAALKITYYDLVPKEKEVKKPSIVTIIYVDLNHITYVYNCIMGMGNIDFIVPICIHSLIKLRDSEDNDYSGAMSILQRTVYNNMTVKSEWEKIMKLQGYEDGLVIDDSGVAENFMNTIHANCYRQIQLK